MMRARLWLAVLAVTLGVTGCGGAAPLTTRVDSADRDRAPDTTLTIPHEAAQDVADSKPHEGARDETPTGVPSPEIKAAREQQRSFARHDRLPLNGGPLAAPEQAGCTSRFVGNHSSRGGVRPRLFVVHYTVSTNRPGWDDVWANVAWFNSAASQASSNYVIDREGHCAYIVRESDKAWAQATFNPVSLSVEIVNSGREASLIDGFGLARAGRVIADATRRWGIPLQRAVVRDCKVLRAGVIDHHALGPCGGGHVDVTPYTIDALLAAAKQALGGPAAESGLGVLLRGERIYADRLLFERRVAARAGGWAKAHRSHLRRATVAKAGLRRANERIHEAARVSGWDRAHRRARHAALHDLI